MVDGTQTAQRVCSILQTLLHEALRECALDVIVFGGHNLNETMVDKLIRIAKERTIQFRLYIRHQLFNHITFKIKTMCTFVVLMSRGWDSLELK